MKFNIALVVACVIGIAYALLPHHTPREVSLRSHSKANLKQIAVAFHVTHDEEGHLPGGFVRSDEGEPLHGWQTELLPYLELSDLHESIDRSKPWDDPANEKAFRTRVEFYVNRGVAKEHDFDARGYPLAHYAANVHVVSARAPLHFRDVTDGMGNTIFGGEVNGRFQAWGDVYGGLRDPRLGINRDPRGFGGPWTVNGSETGATMMMGDGAVRFLNDDIDPAVLAALATPNGGEPAELHQVP